MIEERLDTPSGPTSSSLTAVDEDLALVGIEGTTVALDPQTGTIRWTASLEHQAAEAARGGPGEVILWGPGAPDEVEEAVPDEQEQEATSEGPVWVSQTMHLTAVEAGSGETLWTDRGTWVMGLGT